MGMADRLRPTGRDRRRTASACAKDQDIRRMAELVETYVDLPLGIVDAAVIAIAERLQLTEIATLDQRHFGVVRPSHTRAFTLLPGSDA
jgi:predicted nucleic acid-binding protein